MGWRSFFKRIEHYMGSAFTFAKSVGLTDELVGLALVYVRDAELTFETNAAKREWVIAQLSKIMPDSLASLALELAIQLFHKELDARPR